MKLSFLFFTFLFSKICLAKDCSQVKPFAPNGAIKANVTISKFTWKDSHHVDENICSGSINIPSYDVRGREDDAFYCLQPKPSELLSCKTKISLDDAEITIIPATWVRHWKPKDVREYRFHAYVVKTSNSDFYYDVFSRSLSEKISLKNLVLEGAIKTGPANAMDGYFIRVDFKK